MRRPCPRELRIAALLSCVSVAACERAEALDLEDAGVTVIAAPPRSSAARPVPTAPSVAISDPPYDEPDATGPTFAEQRARLYRVMQHRLSLDDVAMGKIRELFEASPLLGQGRPDDTTHPMSRAECVERRKTAELTSGDPRCGRPNMVPLFDRSRGETREAATTCIDQYEFPNIPCEYPVTYATAREAALLCEAVGARLCDAHEWEGACAGALKPVDQEYFFGKARPLATLLHNQGRELTWAYGKTKDHAKCASMSKKSDRCDATGLTRCGSNSYPAGAFPSCVSPLGVYDQHGNVAEHMNLPTSVDELGSRGGHGLTEMKGSWFVFGRASIQPHEDDCRWRAKDWHPSRVMDPGSHRNYHLGFRCCRDVPGPAAK
jgi:hypothetical protein